MLKILVIALLTASCTSDDLPSQRELERAFECKSLCNDRANVCDGADPSQCSIECEEYSSGVSYCPAI